MQKRTVNFNVADSIPAAGIVSTHHWNTGHFVIGSVSFTCHWSRERNAGDIRSVGLCFWYREINELYNAVNSNDATENLIKMPNLVGLYKCDL